LGSCGASSSADVGTEKENNMCYPIQSPFLDCLFGVLVPESRLFFKKKSSVYYMEHIGRPWQHYSKGSYTPPAHVVS